MASPGIDPLTVPLSVLDLAPIVEGGDATQALLRTLDLARHAERWGYRRFWLAEAAHVVRVLRELSAESSSREAS